MKEQLRRRLPVIRRMRFMSYAASKDDAPETSLRFNRRYVDNRPIGIRARHGMRCWSWVWRTVR